MKKNFSLGISLLLVFLISCAGGTSSQTSLQSISLNTFTVVFESRGGSNIPNQTVEPNSFISPPNVLREGYTFEGWYTSLNNGDTFESKWNFFSDRVNFDFTLYASWTINQYTISFSYKTLQLQEIQHVSAGSRHSLAVTTSGRVYAWGYNFYGQLGDGTTTNRTIPTLISFTGLQSGETIQSVEADGSHSLAVTTSGRVYAWGNNGNGQLGDDTTTYRPIPTLISFTGLQSGETIKDVFAGAYHSHAVTTSGRVYAWGYNFYGQLGDGTTTNRTIPTLISFTGLQSGETIKDVFAGAYHSHAVTTSGRVYAWGYNFYGQLGDGTTTNRPIPTIIIDYPFVTITTLVNNYLTVTYNEAINLLDPTLEGYVFEGWFMNESLTIPYNLTTMPGNDVMLYAKFTPVVD